MFDSHSICYTHPCAIHSANRGPHIGARRFEITVDDEKTGNVSASDHPLTANVLFKEFNLPHHSSSVDVVWNVFEVEKPSLSCPLGHNVRPLG